MNNKKAKYNVKVLLQGKYHGPTYNGYISIYLEPKVIQTRNLKEMDINLVEPESKSKNK